MAQVIGDNFEKIEHVAKISTSGDEQIGQLIAEAIHKVSKEGVFTVEEANGIETTIEVVQGMQFNRGYISPDFVTNSKKMGANASKEGAVIVQRVEDGEGDFGYNVRLDQFENLYVSGVIDPAKVTRVALENAASIAGMFLTTECVIAEKKEDAPAMPAMAPGMGGMM